MKSKPNFHKPVIGNFHNKVYQYKNIAGDRKGKTTYKHSEGWVACMTMMYILNMKAYRTKLDDNQFISIGGRYKIPDVVSEITNYQHFRINWYEHYLEVKQLLKE